MGEKKVVLYSTEGLAGRYFMAELAGDYAGLIPPLVFQEKVNLVAVGRIERPTRGL